MLPLFAPWALLPWDVAWFVWRVGTILLLLWTIHWAYRRRPLTTAVIVAILAFPFAANLDTGNINLQLTLMLWAAQFSGPRLGGLLWALATWMKWVPVVLWPILPGRRETAGACSGSAVVDRAQHPDPAADDHPVPGAVRVRGAPDPARLPRVYALGGRAVAVSARRPVRLPAAGDVAELDRDDQGRVRAPGSADRRRADRRGSPTSGRVLAPALATGWRSSAPMANQTGATRNARRGPEARVGALRQRSTMIPPTNAGDDAVRRRRDVRDAHVAARRGLRDDVGHQRPVDGQEGAAADADEDRADEHEAGSTAPARRSSSRSRRAGTPRR